LINDIRLNGATTSNVLDATMSALALSKNPYAGGVAGAYFGVNTAFILSQDRDLGQKLDEWTD
jgi:hypothetical protein